MKSYCLLIEVPLLVLIPSYQTHTVCGPEGKTFLPTHNRGPEVGASGPD